MGRRLAGLRQNRMSGSGYSRRFYDVRFPPENVMRRRVGVHDVALRRRLIRLIQQSSIS